MSPSLSDELSAHCDSTHLYLGLDFEACPRFLNIKLQLRSSMINAIHINICYSHPDTHAFIQDNYMLTMKYITKIS